jgi:hypothetical protein
MNHIHLQVSHPLTWPDAGHRLVQQQLWSSLSYLFVRCLRYAVFFIMTDVANLEAAFERVTVTDENDEQISTNTTYHKNKVCNDLHSIESVN